MTGKEDVSAQLAQRVADKYAEIRKSNPNQHRLIIAMAGGPGSGKSSIASDIHDRLSSTHNLSCQAIELDGFQFSKAQLEEFDDVERAHKRRGCVWTFDAHAVVDFIKKVRRQKPGDEGVQAPHFDSEKCDPIPEGEMVQSDTQIVIFEGVYFLSNTEPWQEVQDLVDDRWFVHVRPELSRQRVAERRHGCGIAKSLEESYEKYDKSDGKNNEFIIKNRGPVDLIIENNEETSMHEPKEHEKEKELRNKERKRKDSTQDINRVYSIC